LLFEVNNKYDTFENIYINNVICLKR